MPPKKVKNVLIMVANTGNTSMHQNSMEDEPFLDKAKYVMELLVEKKIFLQPKDEIGIITMGDKTNNPNEIDYVNLYMEHLLIPNFEMVKYIKNLSATDYPCNWIEALNVALCFVEQEVLDPNSQVFLVIINNFKESNESIEDYDFTIIADRINNFGIKLHLLFIGENPLNDKTYQSYSASTSEKFALYIMKETNGQYEKIEDFIEKKKFFDAPPSGSVAWKFDLEWDNIHIPCSTYVKIKDVKHIGKWSMQTKSHAQNSSNISDTSPRTISKGNVFRKTLQLDNQRNIVDREEFITGYKYGRKYIPLSEEDEMAMKYSGSVRGVIVYGFVPQNEVMLEYWTGNGSRIIVPQTIDSAVAFYSLVQAMVEKEYVAIVRKVYANNFLPKMGVLFPKVNDDEVWCLVHLELPYVESLRIFNKRTIETLDESITEDKLQTIDNFIDSMTISENCESAHLNEPTFPNIVTQYHWNALAHRALNPNAPLLPLNDYLKSYLVSPEELRVKSQPYIEKLNELFPSCKITKKTKMNKINDANIKKEDGKDDKPYKDNPVVQPIDEKKFVSIEDEDFTIDFD